MTEVEITQVLGLLKTNYPQTYKSYTREQGEALKQMWFKAFERIPGELVRKAVTNIVAYSDREFAPNIGQVMTTLVGMVTKDSEEEAQDSWRTILATVKAYWGEDLRDAYDGLTERTKQVLTLDELLVIGQNSSYENENFFKPRYIKAYKDAKALSERHALETGNLMAIANNEALARIGYSTQKTITKGMK